MAEDSVSPPINFDNPRLEKIFGFLSGDILHKFAEVQGMGKHVLEMHSPNLPFFIELFPKRRN